MVASFVPSPDEPEYFPPIAPSRELANTYELFNIPRRYQELLAEHRTARRQVMAPWSFRVYFPSYIRQSFLSSLRPIRVTDVFMRPFHVAAPVLVQLREMPTAQLSALEAYHRMNLKYVKRGLTPLKVIAGLLPPTILVLSKALPSVITAMEKRGMRVNLQWDAMWASILAFGTQPSNWGIIGMIGGVILGLTAISVAGWWMQRRLEPFGDILTVALAHRHRESWSSDN